MLQDGRLTLAVLALYADEFDQHSGRVKYRAAAFVEFLALEHRARPLVADMQRKATQEAPGARWPPHAPLARL
jgi:predicted SnoaL-like aldol condensation-catalyzing enzyme